MVQLTEFPHNEELKKVDFEKFWTHPKSPYRHRMIEILRGCKEAFLQPQVINVLMEHLADCL